MEHRRRGNGGDSSRRGRILLIASVAAVLVTALLGVGLVVLLRESEPEATHPVPHGVNWPSGTNANPPNDIRAWEEWIGRRTDIAILFTSRDSWQTIMATNDWPLADFRPDVYSGQVSVAQPLFPRSGNEGACARGEYNHYWAEFGRALVRNGRGDAYVRLGWEFNGDWFWWRPYDTETWKACFRQAVTAIRSTSPQVRIDWNMVAHRDRMTNGDSVWDAYPGDEYVDVISVDAYDSYPASLTQKIFNEQCGKPSGACTVAKVARERGKLFAVPEWGVVRSEGGGGDNPFYVEKMYELFERNQDILAYEAYYNAPEANNVQSSLLDPPMNPRTAEKYLELFGAGSTVARGGDSATPSGSAPLAEGSPTR